MTAALVDTHAHLDQHTFADDLDAVLRRAQAVGVKAVLSIGIDAPTSQAAVTLAARHARVFAVVGIQPNYCHEAAPGDWELIQQLATANKVVAIGETGLDRYWDHCPFDLQQDFFHRHIELARRTGLPFVVHCREAEADVVSLLEDEHARHGRLSGVMHSFVGDQATAQRCLALGMDISFAGMVTYKKNDDLRQVAASIPLDRLLVETDSPYLSPEPVRKIRRNEPAHVAHTAKRLAEARGESFDQLARQTTANALRLFRLPDTLLAD